MGMAMIALMSVSFVHGAVPGAWMAGVAKADITPGEPMWAAGYAARNREIEGTLHPLWVKALALEDAEGHKGVLVTTDILGYTKAMSDRIRARLEEGLGLERGQIILSASHTHSGPVVDASLLGIYPLDDAGLAKVKRYTAYLEDKVVATAEAAFKSLKPAQLASANGVCRFAVNRRNNREAAIAETHDLNGPMDHAVPVIRVTGEDGAPMAILFGYACHCTVLDGYDWCGDYAGFAQLALEEAHPGCMALFFAGCGADQNPLPRRSVGLAEQYGKELAAGVTRAITDLLQPLEPTLQTAHKETELLLQEPISREELESIARTGPRYRKGCAKQMLAVLDKQGSLRTSYPHPVALWRLGDQALVALGGEVVVGYSVFIKEMLGHDAFVMGYANDVMSYIPTVTVLEEGGYEGDTSQFIYDMPAKWQPSIEQRVLDAVRELAIQAGALETKDEG